MNVEYFHLKGFQPNTNDAGKIVSWGRLPIVFADQLKGLEGYSVYIEIDARDDAHLFLVCKFSIPVEWVTEAGFDKRARPFLAYAVISPEGASVTDIGCHFLAALANWFQAVILDNKSNRENMQKLYGENSNDGGEIFFKEMFQNNVSSRIDLFNGWITSIQAYQAELDRGGHLKGTLRHSKEDETPNAIKVPEISWDFTPSTIEEVMGDNDFVMDLFSFYEKLSDVDNATFSSNQNRGCITSILNKQKRLRYEQK